MAKKKTVKSAPVKSAGNSEHDYTFKTENMGAYRFDKDCYVSIKVNRTSLDVALGAIIDGKTYATTANLTGGSSTLIRYNNVGEPSADVEIISGYPIFYVPTGSSMYIRYNKGDWESCAVLDTDWTSTSGLGKVRIDENRFVYSLTYSYNSKVKLLNGDTIDFKWEV